MRVRHNRGQLSGSSGHGDVNETGIPHLLNGRQVGGIAVRQPNRRDRTGAYLWAERRLNEVRASDRQLIDLGPPTRW